MTNRENDASKKNVLLYHQKCTEILSRDGYSFRNLANRVSGIGKLDIQIEKGEEKTNQNIENLKLQKELELMAFNMELKIYLEKNNITVDEAIEYMGVYAALSDVMAKCYCINIEQPNIALFKSATVVLEDTMFIGEEIDDNVVYTYSEIIKEILLNTAIVNYYVDEKILAKDNKVEEINSLNVE